MMDVMMGFMTAHLCEAGMPVDIFYDRRWSTPRRATGVEEK